MNGRNDRARQAARRYSLLLHLYPKHHHEAFGAQMRRTFEDQYRDASDRAGGVGLAFWFAVFDDEIKGIVREQIMTLNVRRLLPILLALGLIEFMGIIIFEVIPLPVLLLPIFALGLLFAALMMVVLLIYMKAGGTQRTIATVIIVGIGALSIFGVQSAVRASSTNTWCSSVHPTTAQPPITLATATDYFTLGDYDYDRGDCEQAIADYTEAIARDPAFAEAYNNRAYTAMIQQDYARALPDLDRAIQCAPTTSMRS